MEVDTNAFVPADSTDSIYSACGSLLLQLIRGSNFTVADEFKNQINFQFEDTSAHAITVRAYVISDLNVRATLGWIKVDIKKELLLNITNDPDHPLELSYDPDTFTDFINCWTLLPHEEYEVLDE